MLTPEDERRHLERGPAQGERLAGFGTTTVRAVCDGDAEAVLARSRAVMDRVIAQQLGEWPGDDAWPGLLPEWFVRACAPERTDEEEAAWLARWDRLSPEEREREEHAAAWTLLAWVYWLEPGERQWWWWDAAIEGPEMIVVEVTIDDWPTPLGALEWLLRAAGAVNVDVAAD
jgi:hypothetical protein